LSSVLFTTYRYIVREILVPFIMGVVVVTFVLLMFQILKLTEFLVVQGIDIQIVFKLLYYMCVAFLPITIPVAFLFSVLLVFNRFSADSEMIAFKASGISVYQLMTPVFSVSIIAAVLTFYVSFYEGPWGNRSSEELIYKVASAKAASLKLKEGYFNERIFDGVMLFAEKIDPNTNKMKNVFVYDNRDPKMPVVVMAKDATFEVEEKTQRTGMVLYRGFMNFIEYKGEKYRRAGFDLYRVLLFEGKDSASTNVTPPSMNYTELVKNIEATKRTGDRTWYNKITVEYHRRIAIPFACLIFGFLGIGFGNTNKRNVKTGAGVMSFMVMIIYWIMYVAGTALGTKGTLNPIFSVWLANGVFFIISIYLLVKKR
jgi:lipopolysaccharide export system permease protein